MKLLIPEVIQTSAMDCGPAALSALATGFGVPVSYGRLREACHTDVDGTSIDTIEALAVQLGLQAEQVMVPLDHLLLNEAALLPCIAVVKLEGAGHHFVVVWRKHGPWLQVMDPGQGRRWVRTARFLEEVHVHTQAVPTGGWLEWALSDEFLSPLRARMRRAGVRAARAAELIEQARAAEDWQPLAALDAAVHLAQTLRSPSLVELAVTDAALIPAPYWRFRESTPGTLLFRGAVLIRCRGAATPDLAALPASLRDALAESAPQPAFEILRALWQGGAAVPVAALLAAVVSAVAVLGEALLFRALFSLTPHLTRAGDRYAAIALLAVFLVAVAAVEWCGELLSRGAGRDLEVRFRARFFAKLPRLSDRYFQSRLISDMAQRAHSIAGLRAVPSLVTGIARHTASAIATVAGIGWFFPQALLPALWCAFASVGIPLAVQPWLSERDRRFREYEGALSRFYLDALLGIVPIRAHGAGPALRRSQARLLESWAAAGLRLQRAVVAAEATSLALSYALSAWLVASAMQTGDSRNAAGLMLLVYWALALPDTGRALAAVAWQWPAVRNNLLRLLEPLGAPEEERISAAVDETSAAASIEMRGVSLAIAGHPILHDVNLRIAPGEHVGIVGPSGAGKSSLVGLLLGWHRPTEGALLVDGAPLDATRVDALRQRTAWVDPQVQLWNLPLASNLAYGLADGTPLDAARAIEQANLAGVIESLPEGLQSSVGEGGALLSGGEGQRVRMGRALARTNARLAILDEPARGLDRPMRAEFTRRARAAWRDATLLCITHDIAGTRDFPRVLVIEDGRVVEDGAPTALYEHPGGSRYRDLCDRDEAMHTRLTEATSWRRFRMDRGRLHSEEEGTEPRP